MADTDSFNLAPSGDIGPTTPDTGSAPAAPAAATTPAAPLNAQTELGKIHAQVEDQMADTLAPSGSGVPARDETGRFVSTTAVTGPDATTPNADYAKGDPSAKKEGTETPAAPASEEGGWRAAIAKAYGAPTEGAEDVAKAVTGDFDRFEQAMRTAPPQPQRQPQAKQPATQAPAAPAQPAVADADALPGVDRPFTKAELKDVMETEGRGAYLQAVDRNDRLQQKQDQKAEADAKAEAAANQPQAPVIDPGMAEYDTKFIAPVFESLGKMFPELAHTYGKLGTSNPFQQKAQADIRLAASLYYGWKKSQNVEVTAEQAILAVAQGWHKDLFGKAERVESKNNTNTRTRHHQRDIGVGTGSGGRGGAALDRVGLAQAFRNGSLPAYSNGRA